jgi:hypothetical protein
MKTRYLYLEINEAISSVNYKLGFIASGYTYNKLNNILSKLIEYKQAQNNVCNDEQFRKLCKNFDSFRKRNFEYIF